MLRRVTIVSLAVAASFATPTAAFAAGGWSKPKTVLPAGKLLYQPAIATAADGTTVIVWDQFNADKNTYALMDAVRAPNGKTAMHTLGPAANQYAKPALAVGGDGTFAVAWGYGSSGKVLAVKTMAPGKQLFGATAKVSPSNVSSDYGQGDSPSIAVDDSGTVYVAWEGVYSSGGGKHYEVVETQRAKGSRAWSSPVRLSSSGTDSHGARIAADGAGKVAISWLELNGSVWAATKSSAAAPFGAAKVLATVSYASSPPSIGISDSGKAAVLWEQSVSGSKHPIASKIASPSFPATPQYVSGKAFSRFQAVAVTSNGGGVAAWESEVGGGWEIDGTSLSGSRWGPSSRLDATGYVATFGAAPVVAANDERAVVAWSEKNLQRASFVGARVRVGKRWGAPVNFPGISAPIVSVPNDPVKSGPVAGAMLWLSTAGLQISILK